LSAAGVLLSGVFLPPLAICDSNLLSIIWGLIMLFLIASPNAQMLPWWQRLNRANAFATRHVLLAAQDNASIFWAQDNASIFSASVVLKWEL